jgi:uncharacterized membrane protein YcjF (UPF0283 family)
VAAEIERCHDDGVGYASPADYRAALRDHRSWPVTVVGFVALLIPVGLIVQVTRFVVDIWVSTPRWSELPAAVAVTLSVVWADAAHRIAGRRYRTRGTAPPSSIDEPITDT